MSAGKFYALAAADLFYYGENAVPGAAPTLLTNMTRYWTQLEGVSLAGRHWLKQCLMSTPEDAWYLTRFDVNTDAAVRVMPANAEGAAERLALWRRAMEFDHPHIVRMLDAGRTEAEGVDLIYAVCEYPDEFMAGVLADRPLSPAETREVLNAVLAALAFLHGQDLAHGAVDASHITAFGDTIKLRCDTVRPVGDGVSPADDMWSLGATLHYVLTQRAAETEGERDYADLPEPFAAIVRNTLKQNAAERWTVKDVERHLNPPPVEPVKVVVPKLPVEPVVERPTEPAPEQVGRRPEPAPEQVRRRPEPTPGAASARAENLSLLLGRPRKTPPPPERGFPMKWVPVAGLLAAVGLSLVVFRKPAEVETPPRVEKARPVESADRVVTPAPRVQAPVAPAVAPAVTRNPAAIWRVVAYTYNARNAAEKKARSINQKRPAWQAEVFAPRGDRAPFYVSLGGRMTLPQAERLQKEVRSKGLPQDTFVRNFSN